MGIQKIRPELDKVNENKSARSEINADKALKLEKKIAPHKRPLKHQPEISRQGCAERRKPQGQHVHPHLLIQTFQGITKNRYPPDSPIIQMSDHISTQTPPPVSFQVSRLDFGSLTNLLATMLS